MGFQLRLGDLQSRARGLNARIDDKIGIDPPQSHADQVKNADLGAADQRADVQADELKDQPEDHQQNDEDEDDYAPENRIIHAMPPELTPV